MMRKICFVGVIILLLFLGGCAGKMYKTEGGYMRGKQFYSTAEAEKQAGTPKGETMWLVCSYYGKKFHGRKTANGETFDMFKLSCAHKVMAFGTMLEVTNPDNGESVVVKVNDRGPFIEGRDIDLSYEAARQLGILNEGVKKMKVKIIEEP